MSIEKKIDELIEAINANTAIQKDILSARSEVVAAASKLAEKTSSARDSKSDDDKPASSRGGRGGSAKSDDDKPASSRGGRDSKADEITFDDIKAGYSKFLNVSDDDERADRAREVKRICDKLDIKRVTDADERYYPALLEILADLKAGKKADLTVLSDSGKGDDGDLV